jgi:hypothetical protein
MMAHSPLSDLRNQIAHCLDSASDEPLALETFIRGLVLLLRYSGMRIGDAVNFNTNQIEGNRLFLYTQKTGVPVNAILPEFVIAALDATPRVTERFLFLERQRKTGKHCSQLTDTSAQTLQISKHSRRTCASIP